MEEPDQELCEPAPGLKQPGEAGPQPLPLLLPDQSLELEINLPQMMIIHPGRPSGLRHFYLKHQSLRV